jgi:ATP-dependent Clp protease ATP-binding subunit ClpB
MEITDEVKTALHISQALAKEYSNATFGPAHLLKGIMHKDVGLASILHSWDVDVFFIEDWTDVRLEAYPKGRVTSEPVGDEFIAPVINEAENIALKFGRNNVDALSILASLSTPGVGFTYEQLKTLPLNQQLILEKMKDSGFVDKVTGLANDIVGRPEFSGSSGALLKYCIDLVSKARNNKAGVFLGREQELVTIAEILCRHSKPNVIITGEAGVGKTALVRGFAQVIALGGVPENLKNAVVYELDLSALLAGATYKSETEDRFRNIINDLSKFEKPVLFIDDIHNLFDKAQTLQGVVNIMRSELAKGTFILIATTLTDEYRKKLEPEISLVRWCEIVPINEPTNDQACEIVKGVMTSYSEHHKVTIEEGVVAESVKLSKRFIKERKLPDAVIDVLDRTMASLQLMHHMGPKLSQQFSEELSKLKEDTNNDQEKFTGFYKKLLDSLNYQTIAYIDADSDKASDLSLITPEKIEEVFKKLNSLEKNKNIKLDVSHVAATISKICGIPAGKILSGERERLINMEEYIQSKVIGQDQAVKVLADAILESRSGLSRPGQPIGSFFLLGPTGTGKTELAKQLAEFLFQSTSALIRFDMSEFKEEHSAALLYGAPPGYVGYEEGGLLVNKIKQQPYSVVLFDEIEKAHTSVFDIFLQILDEGKISDKLGRVGDFSNAVILFTSNIGSQFIVEAFKQKGLLPSQNEMTNIMSKYFRPEFLGRLSGIVPFAPIAKENVVKILKLQLLELDTALSNQGIVFTITDEAADKIATEGYTPEYGARPLRSVIRTKLKTPLSRMIISGKLGPGNIVIAKLDKEGELELECNTK